jgi:hypothetical protein
MNGGMSDPNTLLILKPSASASRQGEDGRDNDSELHFEGEFETCYRGMCRCLCELKDVVVVCQR